MNNKPRITVVTPSYNQGEFIEETIKSVLNQDYNDFEHLVIDGGSTDNTLEILKKYPHLNWISEQDKGQSDALNKGFLRAKGDWILWLNSDDILEPNTFKLFLEKVSNSSDANFIHGYVKFFYDKTNVVFKRQYFSNYNKFRTFFRILTHPSSGTFYKSEFLKNNLLDINFHYMMDTEWCMRCADQIKLGIIDDFTVRFRVSDVNKTSAQIRTGKLNVQQDKELFSLYQSYVLPIMSRYPEKLRPLFYRFFQFYFRSTYRLGKIRFYVKDFFYNER